MEMGDAHSEGSFTLLGDELTQQGDRVSKHARLCVRIGAPTIGVLALLAFMGAQRPTTASSRTRLGDSVVSHAVSQPETCANGFPPDFVWGLGTAAYQIEGGANLTGKRRPVAYVMYARDGTEDTWNFPDESVWDPDSTGAG